MSYEPGKQDLKGEFRYVNNFLMVIPPLWDELYYLNNQGEKLEKLV